MYRAPSRRDFIKRAAAVSAGLALTDEARALMPRSANDMVNFACIGVGGKGSSDSNDAFRFGNVVAICDVDDNTLKQALNRFPLARVFNDYRVMLDELGSQIDAVTVSTPDHHHAPASAFAMQMGKHCFCQKPLTHSLYEARKLADIAKRHKVMTQMGNQGTAGGSMRKNAALVKAGAIGTVKEVHVWTNRPIWPQGGPRNAPKTPPDSLKWDLWLGPAPVRPYAEGYHTFAWRGWWDFGTGALGDMACHTLNLPFMALDLRDPISVEAHSSGHNKDSYPKSCNIRYEFAATKSRPAITLFWYDGTNLPASSLLEDVTYSNSGSLIIGDKGKLYTPGDYGGGGKFFGGNENMKVEFPQSPGHFEELVRAIKEGIPAMSNFPDYSGPLSETVLLGNLAVWADGKKVEWDAKKLRAKNAPEVASLVKPKFRTGYQV